MGFPGHGLAGAFSPGENGFAALSGLLQRVETLFPRTAKRGRHGIKFRLGRRARVAKSSRLVTAQPRKRCESKACIRQERGCLVEAGGAISLSCVDEGVPDRDRKRWCDFRRFERLCRNAAGFERERRV
jgi:hypothetical protein